MISAWCMQPALKDIDFAASIGLTRLDIMVNDFAAERKPQRFWMVSPNESYATIVRKCRDVGIREVHFTSWIMPHVDFCKEAADTLQQLALDTGADGVMFDAEEPWTQAKLPNYDAAVAEIVSGMKGCRFGVTGIGWASKWVRPLAHVADYLVPQLYYTSTSGLEPHEFAGPIAHWSKWLSGETEFTSLVPALAAYRTTPAKMQAAYAEVTPCDTVIYWALRHLKSNKGYAAVIAELAKEEKEAA